MSRAGATLERQTAPDEARGYRCDPPSTAVPLSPEHYRRLCLQALIGELARLPLRRRRTPERAKREYEDRWHEQAGRQRWLTVADVRDATALSSFGDATLCALIESRPYKVPAVDFFRWRAAKLTRIFGAHYSTSTPIVEIGCGLGKNLLALAAAGYSDITGCEPSASALVAVEEQARHFGLPIEALEFDLLAPNEELVSRLPGTVLFTNHVLEQFPGQLEEALDCLLAARPREVIHLEPTFELLRPGRRLVDLVTLLHAFASDYQRTLLTALRRLEREQRILLLEVEPLGYSPKLANAPTLIRWRPVRGG